MSQERRRTAAQIADGAKRPGRDGTAQRLAYELYRAQASVLRECVRRLSARLAGVAALGTTPGVADLVHEAVRQGRVRELLDVVGADPAEAGS